MSRPHPETISPTAHYTGYVWLASGLSHEAFATRLGRLLYGALRAPNAAARVAGLPSLPGMLLARHRLIDLLLARAIDAGEVSQVVEIAAGLSPRGWRFRTRYGDAIDYIEADLPDMARHKRRILADLGGETPHHRTVEIDALADDGPASLDALAATLDPSRGVAIVTEGLINYFSRDTVIAMWRRFARALARFPNGLYLSDLVQREDNTGPITAGLTLALGAFVRGKVHVDLTQRDAERELAAAGMPAAILDPRDFASALPGLELAGASRVRVIQAKTP